MKYQAMYNLVHNLNTRLNLMCAHICRTLISGQTPISGRSPISGRFCLRHCKLYEWTHHVNVSMERALFFFLLSTRSTKTYHPLLISFYLLFWNNSKNVWKFRQIALLLVLLYETPIIILFALTSKHSLSYSKTMNRMKNECLLSKNYFKYIYIKERCWSLSILIIIIKLIQKVPNLR